MRPTCRTGHGASKPRYVRFKFNIISYFEVSYHGCVGVLFEKSVLLVGIPGGSVIDNCRFCQIKPYPALVGLVIFCCVVVIVSLLFSSLSLSPRLYRYGYFHLFLPVCLPACLPACLPSCLPAYLPSFLPSCLDPPSVLA